MSLSRYSLPTLALLGLLAGGCSSAADKDISDITKASKDGNYSLVLEKSDAALNDKSQLTAEQATALAVLRREAEAKLSEHYGSVINSQLALDQTAAGVGLYLEAVEKFPELKNDIDLQRRMIRANVMMKDYTSARKFAAQVEVLSDGESKDSARQTEQRLEELLVAIEQHETLRTTVQRIDREMQMDFEAGGMFGACTVGNEIKKIRPEDQLIVQNYLELEKKIGEISAELGILAPRV